MTAIRCLEIQDLAIQEIATNFSRIQNGYGISLQITPTDEEGSYTVHIAGTSSYLTKYMDTFKEICNKEYEKSGVPMPSEYRTAKQIFDEYKQVKKKFYSNGISKLLVIHTNNLCDALDKKTQSINYYYIILRIWY